MPPPATGVHAQDQVAFIKATIQQVLPHTRCFLDVDDLESIEKLEQYVSESAVVLIFFT